MPPRWLSDILKEGQITTPIYGTNMVHQMVPDLMAAPMSVISYWAEAETSLALLLCRFLDADIAIGVAMYGALRGSESRYAVVLGAARQALKTEDFNLLSAVISVTKASRDRRNEFAHHIWGVAPNEFPDHLFLVAPTDWIKHRATKPGKKVFRDLEELKPLREATLTNSELSARHRKIMAQMWVDPQYVQVFRKRDMAEEVKAAKEALQYMGWLNIVFNAEHPGAASMRAKLLDRPPIRLAFEKGANSKRSRQQGTS